MAPTDLVFNIWFLLVGVLFVTLALASTILRRLPVTTALLYLAVGVAIGPIGLGLATPDPVRDSLLLERFSEIVVIISLFSAGLKLRTPLTDFRWSVPVRLASISMVLTIGMITFVGVHWLGLPLGAAALLGAVLAPTDPVLASDVQVENPHDTDRLRFGVTGEAGLNDGTAFPFVMLALGLLGLHDLGQFGWRWFAVDVLWAITAGLAIGALLGTWVGKLILHLRQKHRESIGTDDFLALGLIALSYAVALFAHSYGFLAVFAAGLALRRIERLSSPAAEAPADVEEVGLAAEEEGEIKLSGEDEEEHSPAYMAGAVLGFSEQLERIGTVGIVLLVGSMLSMQHIQGEAIGFVLLLFFVIRPLSVVAGLLGTGTDRLRAGMVGWFGVRGIGSIYYLMYAVEHGLPEPLSISLTSIVLTAVAASVVLHGISVTPLMKAYGGFVRRAVPWRREEPPPE